MRVECSDNQKSISKYRKQIQSTTDWEVCLYFERFSTWRLHTKQNFVASQPQIPNWGLGIFTLTTRYFSQYFLIWCVLLEKWLFYSVGSGDLICGDDCDDDEDGKEFVKENKFYVMSVYLIQYFFTTCECWLMSTATFSISQYNVILRVVLIRLVSCFSSSPTM